MIYYSENLHVYERDDLKTDIEAIWIDITVMSQKLLLGCIYRPPDDYTFYDKFYNILENTVKNRKNVVILGDFNSDLIAKGYEGRRLLRILGSHDLHNVIKEPTRVTETTSTLLDLLITTDTSKITASGTFDPGLSDHCLIYGIIKLTRSRTSPKYINAKNYKRVNVDRLKHDFSTAPWSAIEAFEDVDDVAWAWETLYKDIISEHIPQRRVKTRSDNLPWMNSHIRKIMNKRYKVLKRAKQTRSAEHWAEYKKLRNQVTKLLRESEANYWRQEFKNTKCSKDFWKLVSTITHKKKPSTIGPLKDDQGTIITDDQAKAEAMNDYFVAIGPDLASKVHPAEEFKNTEHLYRVTPTLSQILADKAILLRRIKNINPNKASGPDTVAPRELHLIGEAATEGLFTVCKHSLQSSKVPTQWKTSRMLTTHKKGNQSVRGNYRPLQMLSLPSKLLEGLVCEGLDNFTTDTGHLNDNQWGFRQGRSSEDLLIHLTETWKTALDNRQVVGVVFIDFQKAFDTVSHETLRYKLQAMGFNGNLLDWLTSYLKDRKQFASVNGYCSQTKMVSYGVPQGSLLGPRLFTYYVNDLSDSVTEGNLALYADDTTLYVIGNNVDEVIDGLNRALSEIYNWCRNNKLTMHAGKTEAMIISSRTFCGPLKPIKLGDKIVNFVSETRCLGVTIDSKLSWNNHSEHLCKSFGKKVKQIRRFKYLPTSTLETIYFTSIVPTVTYCNLVWGTSSSSLMNELEHAHARAAKIIHRLPWKTPDQDVLTATGWEPLRNFYTKNVLKLMYKVQYNLTSDKIIGLFSPKTSSRAYNLRNTSSFISPRFNLDIGRTTLRYRGPLAWNLLPSSLKQAPSLNSFKQALKRTANTVNNIQFEKGACLIANKKADFIYY